MQSFYITTAIDYVNGAPHVGHAYEKVLTDVIARFRRQMGDRVHFLTGADEHGQKVQASAKKAGLDPQSYVDRASADFRALYDRLNVSYDDFIRTTEPRHKKVVRGMLEEFFDKGEIYQAEYKGFYSTRQEQFLQEKDRLPDGTWPEIFGEVTEIVEANYFFKLRQYQEWLVQFLTDHPDFIFPRYRQKQVLEFLKEPLNDLCISRPKERLEWGIPLPLLRTRSEEHTSELQSPDHLVCRLLLEKKKKNVKVILMRMSNEDVSNRLVKTFIYDKSWEFLFCGTPEEDMCSFSWAVVSAY